MEKLEVFNYEGANITFKKNDNDVMINLTEMAKPFGKLPAHFLGNEQTKQFIEVLKENVTIGIPIVSTSEGRNGGTWGHQKIALKFAAWLNPRFELWVYDRIEELLKHGFTASPATLDDMIANPDLVIGLATELKRERAEKELLLQQTQLQAKALKESAPKVHYCENVLQSGSLILTNVIAKELGMSATTLNRILRQKNIIYKSGDTYVLYHKYQNMGYTGTHTYTYIDGSGTAQTSIQMCWTEKGRAFIHSILNIKMENKVPVSG